MTTMTNNLLKNLTATFVIVFTVGVGGAWAEEIEFKKNPNNLPLCPAPDYSYFSAARYSDWNKCWGIGRYSLTSINYIYEGEWVKGQWNGLGKLINDEGVGGVITKYLG